MELAIFEGDPNARLGQLVDSDLMGAQLMARGSEDDGTDHTSHGPHVATDPMVASTMLVERADGPDLGSCGCASKCAVENRWRSAMNHHPIRRSSTHPSAGRTARSAPWPWRGGPARPAACARPGRARRGRARTRWDRRRASASRCRCPARSPCPRSPRESGRIGRDT